MRKPNIKTTKYQSEESGRVIKEKSRFGVEIEVYNPNGEKASNIENKLDQDYGIVHDGSIERVNGIEIVSPILKGKAGEESLIKAVDILKGLGFKTGVTCGFHVHIESGGLLEKEDCIVLDCKDRKLRIFDKIKREIFFKDNSFEVMSEVVFGKPVYSKNIRGVKELLICIQCYLDRESIELGGTQFEFHKVGNVIEVSIADIDKGDKKNVKSTDEGLYILDANPMNYFRCKHTTTPPTTTKKKGLYYIEFASGGNFPALKNIFLFYTVFTEIFMAMLPQHRRSKNIFCKKLNETFTSLEISKLKNQQQLEEYWYKINERQHTERGVWSDNLVNSKGDHYNWSRYHGVNLHSLFQHKTIEVRWHEGTLDVDGMLYWVSLHQHIISAIRTGGDLQEKIMSCNDLFLFEDKLKLFFKVIGINKNNKLYRYVIDRINKFNKTNIK